MPCSAIDQPKQMNCANFPGQSVSFLPIAGPVPVLGHIGI